MEFKTLPVSRTNLSEEERAMLADPDFVTPDEAVRIVEDRRRKEPPLTLADQKKILAMIQIRKLLS